MADKANNLRYRRSKIGLTSRMYSEQVRNSKKRRHTLPTYSKIQLIAWLDTQNFSTLYQKWVTSEYLKKLTPSCDRINDTKGYTLANLQLITFRENEVKQHQELRKTGLCFGGSCTPQKVACYTKTGILVREYPSIGNAAKTVNRSRVAIIQACKGRSKTSANYIWKYI